MRDKDVFLCDCCGQPMTKVSENKKGNNANTVLPAVYNPKSCRSCKYSEKQYHTDVFLRHLECMHVDGKDFGLQFFYTNDYFTFS